MKITPAWRVYILGATLCVALTICSRNFGDRGGPYFMASLTLAGISYLLAIREFFATPRFSRRVVVIGLVLAAGWHIEFLRVPSGADDDIHRYVWDGRLQRLGYNPYLVVPSDPAVKGLHTPETRNLNNPDLPSPYPAGAQLFFRAVTAIQESTFALKVAFVVCELAIILVLLDLLRRKQAAHLVLAFAWNPLLAVEVAGSGHIDIVGALLLLVSAVALVRRWRATAAVGLGLAIAVKLLPVVLVPLYWKRVRIRDAALAAAVVGLLYVPFLNHGRIPPVVFPWYLLWLLPFLTSASTLLIILWTVSIIPTYVMWHLRTLGRPWGSLPGWVMLLEYGCVATAGAMIALRRLMRPAAPRYSNGIVQSSPLGRQAKSVSENPGVSSKTTSVQFTEEGRS